MIKNAYWSSSKVPLFLPDFNDTWFLSIVFSKNTQTPNFIKICPVEVELSYAERPMDRHTHDEANSRFSQFCERF